MEVDIQNSVRKFAENLLKNNMELENLSLGFFGGEPLLEFYDVVHPLISTINALCNKYNKKLSVNFTSNGFLISQDIINTLKNYDCSFQITLDGGKSHHDTTRFQKGGLGSFDKILNNIFTLIENGIKVTLRVNYTKENISSVSDIVSILRGLPNEVRPYLQIDLQRVWQDFAVNNPYDNTYFIAKGFRKELIASGFPVFNNKTLDTVRNSCYGDKHNHVLINYNGDVFMCTARDFTQDERYGILNIDGSIEFNKDKIELRRNSKFVKEVCKRCRIAPRCGGGCRTQAVEQFHIERCLYVYDDNIIDDIILEIFDERFINNK